MYVEKDSNFYVRVIDVEISLIKFLARHLDILMKRC